MHVILFTLFFVVSCHCQVKVKDINLHNGLNERIGNFSIELLYNTITSTSQGPDKNLVISPFTVWTALAVIAEGAAGNTLKQICKAIRIAPRLRRNTRGEFQKIARYLQVNTSTVELEKFNAIFVDERKLPLQDFVEISNQYETKMIKVNFISSHTSEIINNIISNVTHGKVPNLTDSSDFSETQMILTSALYFKGQWTMPFNTSSTTKQPFYNSAGIKIGEVNMMYNRQNYPFAVVKELNARIIELPYGKENRLSMLVMLPHPGVTLQEMFLNFNNINLDIVFNTLKMSTEEYEDEEVDCFLPRFKIESNIVLTDILRNKFNITDLFEESKAVLPLMSRIPMYVSKISHKALIEVTEEGTEAAAVTTAEFSNRIGVTRVEVNRPFCYLIIEKTTNAIVFGGFYEFPSLF